MNQAELRQMAEERLVDAAILLEGGRWEFAYYAAGYAVECALKSCVLAQMVYTGWVFNEEVRKVDECRTHDFERLIDIAGLRDELIARFKDGETGGGELAAHWRTVKLWKVTSRYEVKTESDARKLYEAIRNEPYGVMEWIKKYW